MVIRCKCLFFGETLCYNFPYLLSACAHRNCSILSHHIWDSRNQFSYLLQVSSGLYNVSIHVWWKIMPCSFMYVGSRHVPYNWKIVYTVQFIKHTTQGKCLFFISLVIVKWYFTSRWVRLAIGCGYVTILTALPLPHAIQPFSKPL